MKWYHFIVTISLCWSCQTATTPTLTIKAGASARPVGVPVFFDVSDSLPYNAIKNIASGETIPLIQTDNHGDSFYFLLDEALAINEDRTYDFASISTSSIPSQQPRQDIFIQQNNQDVVGYQFILKSPSFQTDFDYTTSGFLHPIRSPKGVLLTDDFPIGHTHHNGIFHAWVNTTFRSQKVDFWNRQLGSGKVNSYPRNDSVIYEAYENGSTFWVDHLVHNGIIEGEEIPVLMEARHHRYYPLKQGYIIDIQTIQRNISSDTLFVNQYHYGGMAVRMSKAWNPKDSSYFEQPMHILTSEGITRDTANHTRPDWICAYGKIENQSAGLVIMNDPHNFRTPQFVRVHPTMPYFCYTPTVNAGFAIAPMEQYEARYRFYVFDGAVDEERIEQLWKDYEQPMEVFISVNE
ncbi:MAG: PmoA family protein [Bacteroidota bacterium]